MKPSQYYPSGPNLTAVDGPNQNARIKGATWMFEDAYAKYKHWHKIEYENASLETAVVEAATWAEQFVKDFGNYQTVQLPWLKK